MQTDAEPEENSDLDPIALSAAISEIGDLLDLGEERASSDLLARLEGAVKSFAMDRSITPYYGNPAYQKRVVAQLAKSLDKSLSLLLQVAPEYLVTIQGLIKGPARQDIGAADLVGQLERLAEAVYGFSKSYTPKRGAATNLALEEAVRTLVPLLEQHTGGNVSISMNKSKGGSPSLTSPEAKVIGVLLRVADPKLGDATIANMIAKVRREPAPTESHLKAIWAADPQIALDASLHPRRRDGD